MNELTQQTNSTNSTQVEISRAVQEVQAAVLVAQKMPRDEIRATKKKQILQQCIKVLFFS